MKTIIKVLAVALLGLVSSAGVKADTIISVTETHYDAMNRPDCVAVRMNPTTFSNAPANGCVLDASGSYGSDRITRTVYDNAGQVVEVDQAFGAPEQRAYARYTYNPNGTKATEMDANGNKTLYVYDGFDRLSQMQYPSVSVGSGNVNAADYEQFQYDANNNKTSWRRRNGKTISYSYDALNRAITSSVSDGSIQTIYTGYDLLGHVLYARYGSTSGAGVANTYDAFGRLTGATDMNGRTVSYLYDAASNRTRLTYPDGNWQPYTYDAANRVTFSGLGSGNFTISYDGLGRMIAIARGTNAAAGSTSYGYDSFGRLTSLGNSVVTSGATTNWSFSYNPASQIISTSSPKTMFDYVETVSGTTNSTFDGLNRDAGIAALSGGYDANGNLTYDGARTFTYDVYNRLLTATGSGANLSLVYDPLGRLASQTSNGVLTGFVYDGTNLIAEYNSSGVVAQRYVFGPGTDQPLIWFQEAQNTTPFYFLQDYHGSVIGYVDAGANVQDVYKYGAYGEPVNRQNVASFTGARFRYTGQMVIPEARLYYYKARVYDPVYGRFLQTDPIGSKDDLDLYAYTGDDPINGTDPTGTHDHECKFGCQIRVAFSRYIEDVREEQNREINENREADWSPATTLGPAGIEIATVVEGASAVAQVGDKVAATEVAAGTTKSGVPGSDFTPSPSVTGPYVRPSGAGPTAAQKAAVQGQPCVDCGAITPNQVADHKLPLVVQHYQEGAVDVQAQSQVSAVQAHCPSCSAVQGGQLSAFSKAMKKLFGF